MIKPTAQQFALPLMLIAIGCWIGHWVISDSIQGLASQSWPQIDGIVLQTWLEQSSSRSGPEYAAIVAYQYRVNGVEYRSERLSYPERHGAKSEAMRKLAKYPPGSACIVSYDPRSPGDACLEPGPDYGFMGILGAIASGSFIAGVAMTIRLFVRWKRCSHLPGGRGARTVSAVPSAGFLAE
jgi:hypothetical protein